TQRLTRETRTWAAAPFTTTTECAWKRWGDRMRHADQLCSEAPRRSRLPASDDLWHGIRMTRAYVTENNVYAIPNGLNWMVGLGGLEPPTSPLSGARSSHLSYRPVAQQV